MIEGYLLRFLTIYAECQVQLSYYAVCIQVCCVWFMCTGVHVRMCLCVQMCCVLIVCFLYWCMCENVFVYRCTCYRICLCVQVCCILSVYFLCTGVCVSMCLCISGVQV